MSRATTAALERTNSNSLATLLYNESRKDMEASARESPLQTEMEALRISRQLVKTVTQKLKNKNCKKKPHGGSSSGCLSRYVKGGGCRVGACDELDGDCSRKSGTAAEDCMPCRTLMGTEKKERSLKKNSGKMRGPEECPPRPATAATMLPDDVLEVILVRLPLASLMAARCVCRKWRYMTTTPHFLQMRCEGPHQTPWLFLFGVSRDGCRAGEILALDVSLDRWHRVIHGGLQGRSLFSVASIGTELYIVGGRSCLRDSSMGLERSSFKIHKGVLVFSPVIGSWRKAAPMKSARSTPVLGVFEVGTDHSICHRRTNRQERIQLKSRIGASSDVYEDPHRFSLRRRQLGDAFDERDDKGKPTKSVEQNRNNQLKFALIAVGGRGHWDEPLETGEIYDPMSNRWTEIANLPGDFGAVCSGAVCGGMFYVYSEAERLAGYNLERGFWVTIQTSHPPPCLRDYYPKLVSCRGRLFLLSVSWCERDEQLNRRERAVRKLWELDLGVHSWKEVSRHPDAPMDWNATFVANRDRIYGVEMFRIFGQVLDFLTACHVSDAELNWMHISRKHAAHEADASSCTTKSMAVLHI